MYGGVDLAATPYRFTVDPEARSSLPAWVADRGPLLDDEAAVELMRTATMLGDVAADPYAALVDQYGMKTLIGMLTTACREGVDAVPDAPEELRAFIASMEETPGWLDMDLVEEGARHARVSAAFLSPFLTRGAFLGTFINSYAALPMALTGALTDKRAGRASPRPRVSSPSPRCPGPSAATGSASRRPRTSGSCTRWCATTP